MKLHQDVCEVLYTEAQLQQRVAELGAEITRDYEGEEVLMVCTLRGASIFYCDLIRHIDLDIKLDFIATSSYGLDTKSSGEVRLTKDLSTPIAGKHVIIVEDIIDSGLTLKYLKKLFEARNPKSVKICSLLDKPEGRQTELKGDYIGFEIPNAFVVGYGLDYAERYRNLPDVCVLDPRIYAK